MARFACPGADRRALHVTQRFAAGPDDVFAAWLHPALVRRWLFATAGRPLLEVHVDDRPGGAFLLRDRWRGRVITWRGTFARLTPPAALAFTLRLPDAPGVDTGVEVGISPAPAGCRLDVVHTHLPARCAEAMEARWLGALYGLGETLSSLAQARRHGAPAIAG